ASAARVATERGAAAQGEKAGEEARKLGEEARKLRERVAELERLDASRAAELAGAKRVSAEGEEKRKALQTQRDEEWDTALKAARESKRSEERRGAEAAEAAAALLRQS
ncbi:hypothetical protein T484DRAFT_1768608, partial [Baffinella frigidus]